MNCLKMLTIACFAAAAPFAMAQSAPGIVVENDVHVVQAQPQQNNPEARPSVDVLDVQKSSSSEASVEVSPGDPHDPAWQKRHYDAVRIYYNNEAKKENAPYLGVSASPVTP